MTGRVSSPHARHLLRVKTLARSTQPKRKTETGTLTKKKNGTGTRYEYPAANKKQGTAVARILLAVHQPAKAHAKI